MCARHITEVILLNSPQKLGGVGMVSTFYGRILKKARKDQRGETTHPRSPRLGVVKQSLEYRPLDIKACALCTKSISMSTNSLCMGDG